jgi:hypothetical protein
MNIRRILESDILTIKRILESDILIIREYREGISMYIRTFITFKIEKLIFLIVFNLNYNSSHIFNYYS